MTDAKSPDEFGTGMVGQEGLFVEISEDDAFGRVELKAITEDGVGISVGEIEAPPGRYELKRVDNAE